MRVSLLLLGLALAPASLVAQALPLTLPKGKIRLDFSGRFESFDRRFNDGTKEEWAGDFDGPLDRATIAGLSETETILKRITGLSDASLNLGRTSALQLINLGTLGFGGAVGVTDWLTIFGSVPFVRVKARTRVSLDTTGANAGFNGTDPVFGQAAAVAQWSLFAADLTGQIGELEDSLASGFYDADPTRKALAQQTLTQAQSLLTDLQALYGSSPATFLPRSGTSIANAMLQVIQTLQTRLTSLDLPSFSGAPPLPTGNFTDESYAAYLTDPEGPIAAKAFDDVPELSYVGDIEIGAVVRLLDHFPASSYGKGMRSALETTVRLRTARLDTPDRFLDVGTGDRQPDVEVNLVTDLGAGRFGTRVRVGYNLQLAGNQNRRIAPPGMLAPANTLAGLRRNPGDVIQAAVQPYFRIAPYLALGASFDYWRRGADAWDYAAGQPPLEGLDPNVLGEGSKADAALFGLSLIYTHSGVDRHGRQRLPLDARVRWQRVASSATGRVADSHVLTVDLRFYGNLF
ncbi:MAG: hypothetical protein R2909_06860 [Gemmatimonadales bacterium]